MQGTCSELSIEFFFSLPLKAAIFYFWLLNNCLNTEWAAELKDPGGQCPHAVKHHL